MLLFTRVHASRRAYVLFGCNTGAKQTVNEVQVLQQKLMIGVWTNHFVKYMQSVWCWTYHFVPVYPQNYNLCHLSQLFHTLLHQLTAMYITITIVAVIACRNPASWRQKLTLSSTFPKGIWTEKMQLKLFFSFKKATYMSNKLLNFKAVILL